jgi:Fe2+ or Zn2+ uptake regulation protein
MRHSRRIVLTLNPKLSMSTLENTLKQLRLSGLLQTLDVRLQEAVANRLGHAEFLELICQDEVNVRRQRMMGTSHQGR